MQFRDVNPGFELLVLDRRTCDLEKAKVQSVSPPHYDVNAGINDMVVDITIEYKGSVKPPFVFRDTAELGSIGDLIVSISEQPIIREVEAIKSQAEQYVAQYDSKVALIEKCSKFLEERNPEIRRMRETEERFKKLESSVNKIETAMDKILNKLG